jgi:GNAT superfamily N-acetyltransferase
MNVTVRRLDVADNSVREAIVAGLVAFNAKQTGRNDYKPLVLTIEDADKQVIGGLWGRTSYGWLFVELLFIPEALRGEGFGRNILLRAEREAVSRGCHSVWLDTFQFQARGFYERLGYSCFGELADYPEGFSRYFMRKKLDAI